MEYNKTKNEFYTTFPPESWEAWNEYCDWRIANDLYGELTQQPKFVNKIIPLPLPG